MKPERYYNEHRSEMLDFIPKAARTVLDVGCGAGGFGAGLKAKRPETEVWGVEVLEDVAARARQHLDRVITADFCEAQELPAAYFDVVVFNDSLEHFPEPFKPLAIARQVLRDGGVVVCSVPNVRYIDNVLHLLVEADWRYESEGIRDDTHLRFFTQKSICRTLEQAGFDVVHVQGIHRRPWIGWKTRLFTMLFGRRVEDMMYRQIVAVARMR